jgi:hypothetical protein
MATLLLKADGVLRGDWPRSDWRASLALILLFGPVYGAVMGSYGFDAPERLLQVLYSALKMPLLLGASTLICLPAYFVLSTVLGLRDDFRDAFGAILAGQAAMSVALASLAPVTRFFYESETDYSLALLFNALMFALGTGAAQWVMRRGYAELIARNARHRWTLWAWGLMYVFVGIQMGWTLRPFVGSPGALPTFFRSGAFTNAYVEVGSIFGRALRPH